MGGQEFKMQEKEKGKEIKITIPVQEVKEK
jgi:hypothetical protein